MNAKKIGLKTLRSMMFDIDVPDSQIRPYVLLDSDNTTAFAPALKINWKLVEDGNSEGDVALGFLNGVSRWRRQMKYRRKILGGWKGLKIVSEGDSWFQYPLLLDDVIDQIFERYAIYSLGSAGDHIADMISKDEFTAAIRNEKPDVFLISGGGNDLVGDARLATMLHPFAPNRKPENYPNAKFRSFLLDIEQLYRELFANLTAAFPTLAVCCHGYDLSIPNRGQWLGMPMESIGIKQPPLQREIIGVIMDAFNVSLKGVAEQFDNVHYINCRGAVDDDEWHDELHPNDSGYGKVAERFRVMIDSVANQENLGMQTGALCPGRSQRIADAADLADDQFDRLVVRRARALAITKATRLTSRAQRKDVESDISAHFEKINQGADFLPARFLQDGALRADAVCKILVPGGSGTGFLVANHEFVMTNNHVIQNQDVAGSAVAIFGFEDGGTNLRVALDPNRFFLTSEELDFTIVGCDGVDLQALTPVPLLRNPATVSREERVNIVQHPSGRSKEIAIHDNRVTRVQDKVVHYSTDTEPGSSGSPVFNTTWDLVALHHAGWTEPGGSATNEGVRMAAIVAHLLQRQRSGRERQSGIREILTTVQDSSPYLGFFDLNGVADPENREIEVPDFQGTADFADVGFWNIENFNRHADSGRVGRVAGVLDRLSMDIMGLVEVERDAMERLREALRASGNAYGFHTLDVPGSQDLGVLFDEETSEVELLESLNHRYRQELDVVTHGGKKAFPRDPLFARCQIIEGNSRPVEFVLIVVHFKAFGDAQSRERRRLASESLAQIVEDIRVNERLPVILGGDFNEKLNNDVLSALSGSPDLFALTADDAAGSAASFIGRNRRSLIDHIIVSQDIEPGAISGDDAAIVRLDRSVHDFADEVSDHVPVVMRLVMRDAPIDIGGGGDDDEVITVDIPTDSSSVKLSFE